MTRHYVTTAHAPLLPGLRVLHASLRRHCAPFVLHVLAEGRAVFDWCLGQSDVTVTLVDALLWSHPNLAADRLPGRRRRGSELAWTWRWRHAVDVMRIRGPVTGLDVDQCFFSSPEPVFEEIGSACMAVSPHGFAPAAAGLPGVTLETHARYGAFNAGFSHWAEPAPLHEMAELCRKGPVSEDRVFPDGTTRWGEQGALWYVAGTHGARVIESPVNIGPWNIHTQPLEPRSRAGDAPLFGGRPIVSYHFQSLRAGQLADAPYEISARQVGILYAPYLAALAAAA